MVDKETKEMPERPSITWMIKEVFDALCLEDKVKSNKEGSSEESLEKRCSVGQWSRSSFWKGRQR